MDILEKIRKFLPETTTTGDVEQNLSRGNVDVIGGECPDGMVYDKKKKTCVPKDELEEQEEKKCEDGYQWCPTRKKCVPVGSGDGDGPRKYQFHRYTNGRKRRKPRT